MVNYFIYAKDYSISTEGVMFYHQNGAKTLEQFKSDVDQMTSELAGEETQVVYLHWGNLCEEVNETKARKAYRDQDGRGTNTLPETIIEWVKQNIESTDKIKLLYIITDGQINKRSFNKCLALNENIHYEKVVFHALSEDLRCIDLSVTASFIKSSCTIYRNNQLFDETDISKDYDYDKITVDNFAKEKESLKSYIKFKFLTSSSNNARALAEIQQLKKLKNRLNHVTTEYFKDTKDKDTFVREFKNTNWYQSFSNPTYNLKVDIEKSITTLINYIVSDKKSYDFDALKLETTYANEVSEEPIENVNFTAEQEIEFPDIILADEKGIPVILCTELSLLDKIIFNNEESAGSFSKFNSMMECPLFLLNDPDFNESLGYFYTLTAYKQLLQKTARLEPRTRRPYHGGLVLVDTDDFDKYNDYILSATYFEFKKVNYNIGLFYFALWKISEQKPWMDENVVAQFKKYALRRISTTKCKIGLSSLPLDPQVNSSLPTALWYCVEMSTLIFKDDPERFAHERLRMYFGVAHLMIEILKYLDYKLDLDYINKRRDLIKHVMTLKKIPTRREKVLYMVEKIFKKLNGFLVAEIEHEEYVKKLNYLKFTHREMLSDDVVDKEVNLEEYVHFLHHRSEDPSIPICEKTLRPYFMINQNESFYSELNKCARQVVVSRDGGKVVLKQEPIHQLEFNKIVSLYNLYMHCVKDNEKYPTLDEYREYILKKKKFKDDLVNIFPDNVCNDIEQVYAGYESLVKEMNVKDFIAIRDKYVSRLQRVKGEDKVKFENDEKIMKFLSTEERKVNLKRNELQNN